MRKAELIILLIAATVAQAGVRICDVDVYKNVNGWTSGPPNVNYVSQSFTCTADSLLWAEFFVGAANTGGPNIFYNFEIRDQATNQLVYNGHAPVKGQHYEFVHCETLYRQLPLIKGKTYVLKITHSDGDPVNFYYDSLNSYKYGHLILPGQDQSHPEEYYATDLVCRIEGVCRPDSQEVTGQKYPNLSVDSIWTEPDAPTTVRPVRFFAKVINQGTAPWRPVTGRQALLFVFTANGEPIASVSDLPFIGVGGSATVRSAGAWQPQQLGDCLVCAEVRINAKATVESDRDNNTKYRMYQVY